MRRFPVDDMRIETRRSHKSSISERIDQEGTLVALRSRSGFPQTPGLSAPNTGLASRPDQVGPLHFSSNRNQIFNPSAFAVPAYGFFGNATNGSIPGPKDVGFNVALYKTFPIVNRVNFQFRAEAFNVANHPSFGGWTRGSARTTQPQDS
jgi:hypothetical protein